MHQKGLQSALNAGFGPDLDHAEIPAAFNLALKATADVSGAIAAAARRVDATSSVLAPYAGKPPVARRVFAGHA